MISEKTKKLYNEKRKALNDLMDKMDLLHDNICKHISKDSINLSSIITDIKIAILEYDTLNIEFRRSANNDLMNDIINK